MRVASRIENAVNVAALACVTFSAMALAAACSSEGPAVIGGADASEKIEGGSPIATNDAADTDDANDAKAIECVGACRTTLLEAEFGGEKRPVNRAQFGTSQAPSGTKLRIEAHAGGSAACPTEMSPNPDRTLVLVGVPRGAVGRTLKASDGITGTFFDFKNDLGLPPFTKATALEVTIVAEDSASSPVWVAMDVTVTFAEGKVSGHLYAELCASLSD